MRGFTILELIVALALASIGSIAVFSIMRGQIQASYDQGRVGDAQANARVAIDFIVQRVEMAGFGLPGTAVFVANELDNSLGGDAATTYPGTDVFEVRARDPRGTWNVQGGSSAALLNLYPLGIAPAPFNAPITDIVWPYGQRLMIFVTLGQVATLQTAAKKDLGVTSVALNAGQSQNYTPATQQLDQAEAYMVNVSRFRVSAVDIQHPTLVLEDDTDVSGDGTVDQNDALPIANDIEDLQVVFFQDTDLSGTLDPTELAAPLASTAVTDWTQVKAMRVTVVARSANQGAPGASTASQRITVENHTPAAGTDYYYRRTMSETVYFDNRNTASPAYQNISNKFL